MPLINVPVVPESNHLCPLCGSADTIVIDLIRGADLAGAWQRSYAIKHIAPMHDTEYRSCNHCHLAFFTPAQAGNAELYEALQRHDWYYATDKPEYSIARQWLPTSGAVLEVGAGKAAFARYVGSERYLGLEFNSAGIERARKTGIELRHETVQAHAERYPRKYAAVVSFQVLEHVDDPASFIDACVSALAVGGRLLLAVPDHDGLCGIAQNNILDMPPHHVSHWNERALRYVAAHHRLRVLAIQREPISAEHRVWAQRALTERFLRRWAGLDSRVLDVRLRSRVLARLAAALARRWPPSITCVSGHTIVGVFAKD